MKKLFISLTLLVGIGITGVFFTACNNEDEGLKTENSVSFQQKIKLRGTVLFYAWVYDSNGNLVRIIIRCEGYYDTRTNTFEIIGDTVTAFTSEGEAIICRVFSPNEKGNPNKDKFSFVGVEDGICYAALNQDEMLKYFNVEKEE